MSPLPLAPLEWMYGSIVRYRNARFDRIPAQRLGRPVISVGNLSVGGSGKTPLVICLARLLAKEHPDVLSRGYGRSGCQVERVDVQGSAEQFGDEPLLIARSGVPRAYLQVESDNLPAVRMYERLGFAELYRYSHRISPIINRDG